MDLKQIIEQNTNDGVINYEEVDKVINEAKQQELNAVSAKVKSKYKSQISEKEQELAEIKAQEEQKKAENLKVEDKFSILLEEVNSLKQNIAKNEKINNFTNRAKQENVNEQVITQLINSGADLDKIDLTPFKVEKKAEIKQDLGVVEQEQEKEKESTEKALNTFLKWKK